LGTANLRIGGFCIRATSHAAAFRVSPISVRNAYPPRGITSSFAVRMNII
jgi:hypothetical protein